MALKSNTIILNGKRYDAVTGDLLGDTPSPQPAHKQPATTKKPAVRAATVAAPAAKTTVPSMPVNSNQFMDIVRPSRQPASHLKPRQTSRSAALARHAVKKPAPSLKRRVTAQQRTDVLTKQPSIEVKPKLSSYQLDPKRVERSKQIPRHEEVRRHAQQEKLLPPAAPSNTAKPQNSSTLFNQPALEAVPIPDQPSRVPQKDRSEDIFEQALRRANSHEQKPLSRRQAKRRKSDFGKRVLSFSAASFAILLVVGFFAWQQKAAITMRYAAHKAGVEASLPDYKPAGFSVGKFSYSPGMVAVSYTGQEGNFSVIERSSNWDSASLRKSFVATRTEDYQVISAAGRTIFTFDNNATWVDNGIWYQINSSGELSTNELVQLAVSM